MFVSQESKAINQFHKGMVLLQKSANKVPEIFWREWDILISTKNKII